MSTSEPARVSVRILEKEYFVACPHEERAALLESGLRPFGLGQECDCARISLRSRKSAPGSDGRELAFRQQFPAANQTWHQDCFRYFTRGNR